LETHGGMRKQTMADRQDKTEYSAGGIPIHRYKARERDFDLAFGDEETLQAIDGHIARHVGPVGNVFHELLSDLIHVDIHIVEPTPQRNYFTLITSGMSDRPMAAPEAARDCQYAELMLCLPLDWPLQACTEGESEYYWPLYWLKLLARLPHEYNTWLWEGHTIPNRDPAQPFASYTRMCCMMLARPALFGSDFHTLRVHPTRTIHFFGLVPLYREEMDFKLRHGTDKLQEGLHRAGVTELLNVRRVNTCERKGLRFFRR
jgi:hypothetical protein